MLLVLRPESGSTPALDLLYDPLLLLLQCRCLGLSCGDRELQMLEMPVRKKGQALASLAGRTERKRGGKDNNPQEKDSNGVAGGQQKGGRGEDLGGKINCPAPSTGS